MAEVAEEIVVSESGYAFPVEDLLTGRGAIFGKSGSGKSNSMTVVAEELLELGLPMLIVDQDGEYHGLQSEYDVLHAGADADCDRTIGVDEAEDLADTALEDNETVVLDVSGFMQEETERELVHAVVRRLFARENEVQKPFLLVVEEIHEYVPQQGGLDDLGRMLIRVAKRGRKRGLGLCGVSQRPASVDKDFITQCDWIVWHRLTWRNDTKVVGRILGSEYADRVQKLGDGEAYVMTDWGEELRRVHFRLKRTHDAGATPGLEEFGDDHWDEHALDGPPTGGGSSGFDPGGTDDGVATPGDGPASPDAGVAPAGAAVGAGDGEQSASARSDTLLDRTGDVGSGPRGGDDDIAYRGNPIWELGQMLAYIVGAVVYWVANVIRRLVPSVRPRRPRADPFGFPSEESIDWKLTSLLMVVLNLLLLAIVGYVLVFVWN